MKKILKSTYQTNQAPMNISDKTEELLENLFYNVNSNTATTLFDCLDSILQCKIQSLEEITSDLISTEFLDEVREFLTNDNVSLYFGKTLRDLKCTLTDDEYSREHEILFQYKASRNLVITSVGFPYSPLLDRNYNSIQDIVDTVRRHLDGLSGYFYELECIDRSCTVMEPLNATFKNDYRRILLDDRTWLHVEVTPEGLATNVHLIGQSDLWQDKLQVGLLKWDHDSDIVTNIMNIFDLLEFPTLKNRSTNAENILEEKPSEAEVCSICLCEELPDCPGVPLPLCQNPTCGIYFHRSCLFQWLVACAGGRPPAFGVATGSCPSCLQPIVCNEKEQ